MRKFTIGTGLVLGLVALTVLGRPAQATVFNLTVTASWLAGDFNIASTGPTSGALGIPEEDDDKVFGVAPSDGSTTFTLRVTGPADHVFLTGAFGVTHDWYGYSNVELVGTHTFGSASWVTGDILTNLIGPNGATAALWLDTNLSTTPTLASFRMFGDWEGNSADLFLGPRSPMTISSDFILAEYYGGEEIYSRNNVAYSVRTLTTIPEPASMALFAAGLAGLGFARRRRA